MKSTELEKIKKELKANSEYLKKTYHIKKIGIFGSFARGEQTKKAILIFWWIFPSIQVYLV